MNSISSLANDRRGTVTVTAAVLATVVLATVGVAISYSTALHEKTKRQEALDAAVLAGAILTDATDEERIAAAQRTFTANLDAGGFAIGSSTSIDVVSNGAAFLVQNSVVSGRSEAQVRNFFSGIVGSDVVTVGVESAAAVSRSDPVCVLSLDDVSAQGIEIYGTAQFTARNCAAQANSADGEGLKQYGGAVARARQFGVNGGYSGTGFYPRPTTGVPKIIDPFAAIPVPAIGPCVDIASKLIHTPAILEPGTYCGGIRIMANSQIIMQPGVYLMLDGPFRIDSNSTVDGDEVVIAFTGVDSTLYLGSGAIVNLTSPVSGPYTNIQFFQDPASSADQWVRMMGNIKLTFDGVMYFPTQDVWIGGGSVIEAKSPSYIFVTEKLWFQDNSVIDVWQENSRGLDVPVPSASLSGRPALVR